MKKVQDDPEKYPDYVVYEGRLCRHIYHTLNYNEKLDVWKLCVAHGLRNKVIRKNHDSPTAGHLEVTKKFARISQRYYWPRMRK